MPRPPDGAGAASLAERPTPRASKTLWARGSVSEEPTFMYSRETSRTGSELLRWLGSHDRGSAGMTLLACRVLSLGSGEDTDRVGIASVIVLMLGTVWCFELISSLRLINNRRRTSNTISIITIVDTCSLLSKDDEDMFSFFFFFFFKSKLHFIPLTYCVVVSLYTFVSLMCSARASLFSSSAQAGLLLQASGEISLAEMFWTHLADSLNEKEGALLAQAAVDAGQPHLAVMIGKRLARRAIVIPFGYYA